MIVRFRVFPIGQAVFFFFLPISHLIKVTLLFPLISFPGLCLPAVASLFIDSLSSSPPLTLSALGSGISVPQVARLSYPAESEKAQRCCPQIVYPVTLLLCPVWEKNGGMKSQGMQLWHLPPTIIVKSQMAQSPHNFSFDFCFHVLNHRSTSLKHVLQRKA